MDKAQGGTSGGWRGGLVTRAMAPRAMAGRAMAGHACGTVSLAAMTAAPLMAAAVALAVPQTLAAQSASPTPVPTREELQRAEPERRRDRGESALEIDDGIERAPCPLDDARFADLRFTLSQAHFDGLRDLDPSLLDAAWQPYVGQEIAVAKICEIRDRAATILRQRGYLAAVQVPEQTIADGELRFLVVLARIGAVQVRGQAGASAPVLARYISKIENQPLFNTGEVERYLLLARDIPGLDVRLTLQPMSAAEGAQPGDVVAVFDVTNEPLMIDANVQNYGSKAVGRFGGLLRMRANNLTGLGDQTLFSVYSAEDWDEQLVLQGAHEFRVGGEGLTLGAALTYSWARPDIPGPDLFDSETLIASVFARYPLLRSQTRNSAITLGGEWIDQTVQFGNADFSRDQLRIAFARFEYDSVDRASLAGRGGYSPAEPRRALSAAVELRHGLGFLGATEPCGAGFANCIGGTRLPPSRLDADPSAFVLRAEGQLEQRFTPLSGLRLRTRAQYSPDALLGFEQFSGGNYTIGRGYDPGALLGDSGFGVQLEAFYGSLMPKTPGGLALQPYIFGDYVGSWTNNLADDYSKILSAGGGVRATIGRQAALDLSVAAPLKTPPFATRKGDVRVLLSISVQLVPWYQ